MFPIIAMCVLFLSLKFHANQLAMKLFRVVFSALLQATAISFAVDMLPPLSAPVPTELWKWWA